MTVELIVVLAGVFLSAFTVGIAGFADALVLVGSSGTGQSTEPGGTPAPAAPENIGTAAAAPPTITAPRRTWRRVISVI